jgi:hypothetical protein
MEALLQEIIANLFLITGSLGGFFFAFHFGSAGREKKTPFIPRLIIALVVTVFAGVLFFFIPLLLDTINKNIMDNIQNNRPVYVIIMLIINAGLGLYLLLIDIIKREKTDESPARRIVNFVLSLCLFFYICTGFLPMVPSDFKEILYNSHRSKPQPNISLNWIRNII